MKPKSFQGAPGGPLPQLHREALAEKLRLAEIEFRASQRAFETDDSNESRARYAKALAHYDELQGMFPFVMAGMADENV